MSKRLDEALAALEDGRDVEADAAALRALVERQEDESDD